jgi:hypothetical protein
MNLEANLGAMRQADLIKVARIPVPELSSPKTTSHFNYGDFRAT